MIYTCNYKNFKTDKYNGIAISADRGKRIGYNGGFYTLLSPKKTFWYTWFNNIGKISEEENNTYYIEEFYNQVLKELDPEETYKLLDNTILLCYEDNDKFCHRHIVAAWLELSLNVDIKEVKIDDISIEILEKPTYIKETLEKIIKEEKNNSKNKMKLYKRKNSCI